MIAATRRIVIDTPVPGSRSRTVRLDQGDSFVTSRDALKAAGISAAGGAVDVPESDAELRSRIAAHEPAAARERALALLAYRERSSFELERRLSRDGYPKAVVLEVIERMVDLGLVDDERFATLYIDAKRSSGWGRQRIGRALARHGIEPRLVERLLTEEDGEEDEIARALRALRPLRADDPRASQKALGRLMRRGYDYETARTAVARRIEGESDHT